MHSRVAQHLLTCAQTATDPFHEFLYWAWCSVIWKGPLGSSGQLSWSWVPHSFLCTCLPAENGKLASPWVRGSTALKHLKHQCVINDFLILNPKHNITQHYRRKLVIPIETRSGEWYSFFAEMDLSTNAHDCSKALFFYCYKSSLLIQHFHFSLWLCSTFQAYFKAFTP